MGYFADLTAAASWLASIENPDKGWGLTAGQGSSLVNTAEAVFVLDKAGLQEPRDQGIDYLKENLFPHLGSRGPRIRYAAFTLFALAECDTGGSQDFVNQCCTWIEEARNSDFGWGNEKNDNQSNLLSTFQAVSALQKAGIEEDKLAPSLQWLLAKSTDSGWSLKPGQGPTPTATAYAVLCLANTSYRRHDRVKTAEKFLLQTTQWGVEEEEVAGTVWKHSTFAWVLPALMALGENPYSPVVADAIRFMNKLRLGAGGWTETTGGKVQTVRAQFWAVLALNSVHQAFDPAKHVLRIDAERAQETLNEPDFVKIAIRSRWATIVPARIYKYSTYLLQALSLIFLLGIYREVGKLSPRADSFLACACLLVSWLLVKRRQIYFPKMTRFIDLAVATVALIGFLFGTGLSSLLDWLKNLVESIGMK